MSEFWNARAREDALFFIDDRRAYGDPDLERFWLDGERDLETLLAMLDVAIGASDDVLDIGCGVGRLSRVLAGRAHHVYGLDISAEMIARARELNAALHNVDWLVGDGVSLAPLKDASVDAIVSHVVFQHIPDPEITLGYVREMGRVLRPGGFSAFQVSNDPAVHHPRPRAAGGLKALIGRTPPRPKGQDDPAWVGSAVDLDDLRAAATGAGLALERVTGAGTQFCLVLARRAGA